MGFSISDPEADTIKFGEAIVFVSAICIFVPSSGQLPLKHFTVANRGFPEGVLHRLSSMSFPAEA